jgi:hypothetical protein
MASEMVLLTTEEFQPEMKRSDLIGPTVRAVSLAPGGARPTSCHPLYALDGEALLAYSEEVSNPETFQEFIQRWLSV